MNSTYERAALSIMDAVLNMEQVIVNRFRSPGDVTEYDVQRIKQEIKSKIDNEAAALEGEDEWDNYAKYALVAWTDHLMISNPFVGTHWSDQVLEVDFFRTGGTSEDEFFRRCERAFQSNYHNAIEVFFLCFVFGFRGIYKDRSAVSGFTDLPPTAEAWQQRTVRSVLAHLDNTTLKTIPELEFDNSPKTGMRSLVSSLLVFLVLLIGFAATLYYISLLPFVSG